LWLHGRWYCFGEDSALIMKYLTLGTLTLVLFCTLPFCGSAERRHTATIAIAEGNFLLCRYGESETVIHGFGDSVLVEWENGNLCVNGQVHWSWDAVPPKLYPLELLKDLYGNVPCVVEYVEGHSGDETEVWNEAVRHWERQIRSLALDVARQYTSDIESGKTADEAAEAVLAMLRASPLADSPRVDEARRKERSTTRIVLFRWTGRSLGTSFMLTPCRELGPPPPRRPMKLDEFKSFLKKLRRLEDKGPVTVELKGRQARVYTGARARDKIRQQRRHSPQ